MVSTVYIFLFFELTQHKQDIWGDISNHFSGLFNGYLYLALFLMPINWMIESVKWRFLIWKIEKISLWTSFQAVLAGTAISIFTPNRIGDYLGRIFILRKGDRIDGTIATIVGNISQLLVTIIMGSLAIIYFADEIVNYLYEDSFSFTTAIRIFIVLGNIAAIFIFFYFPIFERQLNNKFELFRYPIIKHLNLLSEFNKQQLIKVLLLSLFRFLIYSTQFYFIFKAFHINMDYIQGMLTVFLLLLSITIVPSIAVAELGIRGLIAIFIFSNLNLMPNQQFTDSTLVSVTSLLWLINIVIPAFFGGLFIFKLRFIRKTDEMLFTQKKQD